MSTTAHVIELRKQLKEALPSDTPTSLSEVFPGFSERFNKLIDMCDLDIPRLDDGRQAYIGNLFEASKPAAGDWLKKDCPPKPTTLRTIVISLLKHLKPEHQGDHHPLKVEAWMKYGDEAIGNPFAAMEYDRLSPLVATLLARISKEIGVGPLAFNFDAALRETLALLREYNIQGTEQVGTGQRIVIAQIIRNNLRKG